MNAKEVCNHLIAGGCKVLRLTSERGELLVPKNQMPSEKRPNSLKDKASQIVSYLDRIAVDGLYYIEGASSHSNNTAFTKMPVQIGTPKEAKPLSEPSQPTENVLSYNKALEMQNTIAQLTSKVEQLNAENDSLNEEIDALEEELAELKAKEMGDATQQPIAQAISILPAIVDKWFSQQNEKNALMREQIELMKRQQNARQQRPMQPPVDNEFDYE